MLAVPYPLQNLLMTFAGLVNRHQADVIAYLVEENRVLKEQMKGRALRLSDDQRRRLAAKASAVDKVRMPEQDDLLRGGIPAARRL